MNFDIPFGYSPGPPPPVVDIPIPSRGRLSGAQGFQASEGTPWGGSALTSREHPDLQPRVHLMLPHKNPARPTRFRQRQERRARPGAPAGHELGGVDKVKAAHPRPGTVCPLDMVAVCTFSARDGEGCARALHLQSAPSCSVAPQIRREEVASSAVSYFRPPGPRWPLGDV